MPLGRGRRSPADEATRHAGCTAQDPRMTTAHVTDDHHYSPGGTSHLMRARQPEVRSAPPEARSATTGDPLNVAKALLV